MLLVSNIVPGSRVWIAETHDGRERLNKIVMCGWVCITLGNYPPGKQLVVRVKKFGYLACQNHIFVPEDKRLIYVVNQIEDKVLVLPKDPKELTVEQKLANMIAQGMKTFGGGIFHDD